MSYSPYKTIYIKDYDDGEFIGIDEGYTRFGITDKNVLDYVSVEKDTVNNLTKLSINNGTENFNNFIVIEGLHDLHGAGLAQSSDDLIVSFGSDETVGTEQSDSWFGNMRESNNYDGLGGNDEIIGGWLDDVISGGSGNDRISGHYGTNLLDGGDGFDALRGHTSHNYHINLTNNTLTYLENGHFNIYTGDVLEAAGLSKNGADVLQVDAFYRVYESSDSSGDTLFQEFEKPNNGHWSKVGDAFIGTGSIDSLTGLSHSYILNSWERDNIYREMQDDFNVSDVTTFSNFEEFEGSDHSSGDLIDGRDATQGLSILAHDGDDTVYGSAYSDTISDGYGDDTIYGMGGN